MDVFSLGCTIAEIYLDGSPLFTFSQLLRYRNGEFDLSDSLEKIDDLEVRSLVAHMTQLNPDDRYSAQEYLLKW
jgi:phosphoinositide-3-kinase regulatory subunit 4